MGRQFPDIIVIVLDCVRAADFQGGTHEVRPTPFFDWFRARSTLFERCVSASSWTVPSHASILTGLYPDALGSFSSANGRIPSSVPTFPEALQGVGYATCLISANHNLRPSLGMTRGFDRALWARWGATSLKVGSRDERPFESREKGRTDITESRRPDQSSRGHWELFAHVADLLPRYPAVLDGLSRVIQAVRCAGAPYDGRAAPWIEAAFSDWIRGVPEDVPSCTLINLMDCHEPYLPNAEHVQAFKDWWRQLQNRQDVISWSKGRWEPTPSELKALHSLYRDKIRVLDQRVSAIINSFSKTGRWENAMVVLTSDHGQAFGEGGHLFHGSSTDDAVVRVPLMVKWPEDRGAGLITDSWTSSIDICPSILTESGVYSPHVVPGTPLQTLLTRPRQSPVFSMTEILPIPSNGNGPPKRRFEVAAFEGNRRTSLVAETSVDRVILSEADGDQLQSLAARLVLGLEIGLESIVPREVTPGDRLRSWGYA